MLTEPTAPQGLDSSIPSDRTAAPAAYNGPSPARLWTWSRARQNLLLPYLAPLLFFGFSIATVLIAPELGTGHRLLALGNIVVLMLLFAGGCLAVDLFFTWRLVYCGFFIAVLLAGWPVVGPAALQNALFVPALCALLLPLVPANAIGLAWSAFTLFVGIRVNDPVLIFFGAMSAGLVTAISFSLRLTRSEATLARTRLELEQAMLAAERERIARDMHDILGHSLTAVAIKADIVDRALERRPDLARQELDELRTIARSALTDLRATTAGLRDVTVASEIASARTVLTAAGVQTLVDLRVTVDPGEQEPEFDQVADRLFGFVVREAATNVARHAGASWCRIEVYPRRVSISDDGRGLPAERHGSGLSGLAQRVHDAGGTLAVSTREGGGTVVLASLP